MPTPQKIAIVEKLTADLQNAKSVVFVNYQGLSTSQLEELRRRLEAVGGVFTITKNTLIKLAISDCSLPTALIESDVLRGPTATIFSMQDETSAIKALGEFAKEQELPTTKGGLLDNNFLSSDQVLALGQLPTREQLLAQVLATINAPRANLVFTLSAVPANLVRVVQRLAESRVRDRTDI